MIVNKNSIIIFICVTIFSSFTKCTSVYRTNSKTSASDIESGFSDPDSFTHKSEIFEAVYNDDQKAIKQIFTGNLHMEEEFNGCNPIHFAILKGKDDLAKYMITSHMTTSNQTSSYGYTPLNCAQYIGNTAMVLWLKENGAKE